jgi:hypothetical protein
MRRKTTVKAMHAVKRVVASAVAVMAAVVAAAAMSGVIVQKAVRKVGVTSAVSVAQTSGAVSLAVNSATNNGVNHEVRARSNASRVHRVNRVSHAKAVARSAPAVSVVSVAANNAPPWTLPSKTWHWPTKQPWLRPWVARQRKLARKPRAVSVVIGLASAVAAMIAVVSHAPSSVTNRIAAVRTSAMHQLPSRHRLWTRMYLSTALHRAIKAMQPTSSARRANAAAVTVMVVIAANALKERNAAKTALKHRFLLKIQYQMRLQTSKHVRKQLLNS